MRVISGLLKSRLIKGYDLDGTRPTMDKVKESLFAMIQFDIQGSICLDLFAGSGSLGIEAISNGAKHTYFVDNNPQVIKVLKENIDSLNIKEQSSIIFKDYNQALVYFKDNNIKFDIIFLDPPYNLNLIEPSINLILEYNILNDDGKIICEFEKEVLKEEYDTLICIKKKEYDRKKIYIYKKDK